MSRLPQVAVPPVPRLSPYLVEMNGPEWAERWLWHIFLQYANARWN